MLITSYYIDEENILHTYVGNQKHLTISDVFSDKEAKEIISELNNTVSWDIEVK